jgi:hypothetical protein
MKKTYGIITSIVLCNGFLSGCFSAFGLFGTGDYDYKINEKRMELQKASERQAVDAPKDDNSTPHTGFAAHAQLEACESALRDYYNLLGLPSVDNPDFPALLDKKTSKETAAAKKAMLGRPNDSFCFGR